MPETSTNDGTLELIQREISEVIQREKELRENYYRSVSANGITSPSDSSPDTDIHHRRKPLDRVQSTPVLNGDNNSSVASSTIARLFSRNQTKGVMQRFIKSRGKLAAVANLSRKPELVNSDAWTSPVEFIDTEKPIVPAGVEPRNGFIPVQERMKKELQEMQKRESELLWERQKSQPDLLGLFADSPEPERKLLGSARSVSQLSENDSYSESFSSAPSSLKTARSLADLCDVDDEEMNPPGSLTLIKQWENIIQKNQEART